MRNYYRICMGICLWMGIHTASAQNLDGKITSVFIYNFTKYVKWPVGSDTGDFVIGVIGDTPAEAELQRLASKVKVNGSRPMVIRKITDMTNAATLRSCHILYVARKESKSVKGIASLIGTIPVLIVSEGMGMAAKGSIISIYIDEETDKLKLELNKKELENHQMKASSELLSLAVVI